MKTEWLNQWMPRLTRHQPLSPYRVIWDLMHTVDLPNTIITHDAGSPRDQISPFWKPATPLSYIGWGKTTQLGYGLGLAMGAKLAAPRQALHQPLGRRRHRLHRHGLRDRGARAHPDPVVLLNNFSMAIELKVMPVSTEKFRSTDISGNYADMAKAFGGYGERVTEPGEIIPAIKRAIKQTQEGTPALLEFITEKAVDFSMYREPGVAAREYRFAQVDVFTDRVFGGNPLAVVFEATGLADGEMQAIAKEMNLSETTFLLPPTRGGLRGARANLHPRARAAVRRTSHHRHRVGAGHSRPRARKSLRIQS